MLPPPRGRPQGTGPGFRLQNLKESLKDKLRASFQLTQKPTKVLLDDEQTVVLQLGSKRYPGVARTLRCELWVSCIQRKSAMISKYSEYLSQDLPQETSSDIDKDIARTYPNYKRFHSSEGQLSLRNVLRAYAAYDPEVGYCQGMNFLAGLLLMFLPSEGHAFAALVLLMDEQGLHKFYCRSMSMLQVQLWQLGRLLPPKLCLHLESCGVVPVLYAASWLMTCYSADFPVAFAARIMDVMLAGRCAFALLKVAITILRHCERRLRTMADLEDILSLLKFEVPGWEDDALHDILNDSFSRPWTPRQLHILHSSEGVETVAQAMERVMAINNAATAFEDNMHQQDGNSTIAEDFAAQLQQQGIPSEEGPSLMGTTTSAGGAAPGRRCSYAGGNQRLTACASVPVPVLRPPPRSNTVGGASPSAGFCLSPAAVQSGEVTRGTVSPLQTPPNYDTLLAGTRTDLAGSMLLQQSGGGCTPTAQDSHQRRLRSSFAMACPPSDALEAFQVTHLQHVAASSTPGHHSRSGSLCMPTTMGGATLDDSQHLLHGADQQTGAVAQHHLVCRSATCSHDGDDEWSEFAQAEWPAGSSIRTQRMQSHSVPGSLRTSSDLPAFASVQPSCDSSGQSQLLASGHSMGHMLSVGHGQPPALQYVPEENQAHVCGLALGASCDQVQSTPVQQPASELLRSTSSSRPPLPPRRPQQPPESARPAAAASCGPIAAPGPGTSAVPGEVLSPFASCIHVGSFQDLANAAGFATLASCAADLPPPPDRPCTAEFGEWADASREGAAQLTAAAYTPEQPPLLSAPSDGGASSNTAVPGTPTPLPSTPTRTGRAGSGDVGVAGDILRSLSLFDQAHVMAGYDPKVKLSEGMYVEWTPKHDQISIVHGILVRGGDAASPSTPAALRNARELCAKPQPGEAGSPEEGPLPTSSSCPPLSPTGLLPGASRSDSAVSAGGSLPPAAAHASVSISEGVKPEAALGKSRLGLFTKKIATGVSSGVSKSMRAVKGFVRSIEEELREEAPVEPVSYYLMEQHDNSPGQSPQPAQGNIEGGAGDGDRQMAGEDALQRQAQYNVIQVGLGEDEDQQERMATRPLLSPAATPTRCAVNGSLPSQLPASVPLFEPAFPEPGRSESAPAPLSPTQVSQPAPSPAASTEAIMATAFGPNSTAAAASTATASTGADVGSPPSSMPAGSWQEQLVWKLHEMDHRMQDVDGPEDEEEEDEEEGGGGALVHRWHGSSSAQGLLSLASASNISEAGDRQQVSIPTRSMDGAAAGTAPATAAEGTPAGSAERPPADRPPSSSGTPTSRLQMQRSCSMQRSPSHHISGPLGLQDLLGQPSTPNHAHHGSSESDHNSGAQGQGQQQVQQMTPLHLKRPTTFCVDGIVMFHPSALLRGGGSTDDLTGASNSSPAAMLGSCYAGGLGSTGFGGFGRNSPFSSRTNLNHMASWADAAACASGPGPASPSRLASRGHTSHALGSAIDLQCLEPQEGMVPAPLDPQQAAANSPMPPQASMPIAEAAMAAMGPGPAVDSDVEEEDAGVLRYSDAYLAAATDEDEADEDVQFSLSASGPLPLGLLRSAVAAARREASAAATGVSEASSSAAASPFTSAGGLPPAAAAAAAEHAADSTGAVLHMEGEADQPRGLPCPAPAPPAAVQPSTASSSSSAQPLMIPSYEHLSLLRTLSSASAVTPTGPSPSSSMPNSATSSPLLTSKAVGVWHSIKGKVAGALLPERTSSSGTGAGAVPGPQSEGVVAACPVSRALSGQLPHVADLAATAAAAKPPPPPRHGTSVTHTPRRCSTSGAACPPAAPVERSSCSATFAGVMPQLTPRGGAATTALAAPEPAASTPAPAVGASAADLSASDIINAYLKAASPLLPASAATTPSTLPPTGLRAASAPGGSPEMVADYLAAGDPLTSLLRGVAGPMDVAEAPSSDHPPST